MGEGDQLVQNRMPYVQWLVEHVTAQLTPEEVAMRSQPDQAPSIVEAARRDAEESARQVSRWFDPPVMRAVVAAQDRTDRCFL